MPRDVLMQSDQYAAPFQQQAAHAEQQAYAQAPQLAIQAFLQIQEHQRRSRESAAHVAVEQGKLQELQIRNQAYVGELQTRQLRAQTLMLEAQTQAAIAQQKAAYEPFKGTKLEMGKVYAMGQGKDTAYKVAYPSSHGPQWQDATDEQRAQYLAEQEAKSSEAKSKSAEREAHIKLMEAQAGAAGRRGSDQGPMDYAVAARLGSDDWKKNRLSEPARKMLTEWESEKKYGTAAISRFFSKIIEKYRPAEEDKADFIARYLDAIASDKDRTRRDALEKDLDEARFKSRIGATR